VASAGCRREGCNDRQYLENQQTDPDIKVPNQYGVVAKGKDQELGAAMATLMKMIQCKVIVP
jgi:hypothetical protein